MVTLLINSLTEHTRAMRRISRARHAVQRAAGRCKAVPTAHLNSPSSCLPKFRVACSPVYRDCRGRVEGDGASAVTRRTVSERGVSHLGRSAFPHRAEWVHHRSLDAPAPI